MSDDLIELLRRHDPARGSAGPPPVERVLALIDEDPRPSGSRVPWRRSGAGPAPRARRPIAVAVALLCLAALAVGVAVGGDGEGRDDALAPAADRPVIVHVVTRTTYPDLDGRRIAASMTDIEGRPVGTADGPVERWIVRDPLRWREVATLLPGRGMPGGTSDSAFAVGLLRTQESWETHVRTMPASALTSARGFADAFARPGSRSEALLDGVADPCATAEAMIAAGEASAAGEIVRDGRTLRQLVAEEPSGRGGGPALRTTYLLDADSCAPVEVSVAPAVTPKGSPVMRYGDPTTMVFDAYETISLDASTEHLLRLGGR